MSGEVFRATEYAELSRTFAEACQTQAKVAVIVGRS
jgi:hypothetical protein